jgi:hypothetical protein
VGSQEMAGIAAARDEVDHARRKARFDDHLTKRQGSQWRFLGRFEDALRMYTSASPLERASEKLTVLPAARAGASFQ